ncbi:unnamed protein product [Closterium sp. Yama58-4]|nr:unnamed protein product [Closterium sp. Yama58-4]
MLLCRASPMVRTSWCERSDCLRSSSDLSHSPPFTLPPSPFSRPHSLLPSPFPLSLSFTLLRTPHYQAMGALGDGIVDPRVCFWSRETDDNPASCITGRVRVKRVKPPSGPQEPLDIPADTDFVYYHMYSYDFASFSDIPNDECKCGLLTRSRLLRIK